MYLTRKYVLNYLLIQLETVFKPQTNQSIKFKLNPKHHQEIAGATAFPVKAINIQFAQHLPELHVKCSALPLDKLSLFSNLSHS